MPAWDDVVVLGGRLPEVEVTTWFGTPALKLRGKGMCRMSTDPDALVLRVLDIEDAQALLRARPEVFFSTSHYDGHPYVLVRLDAVEREQLAELLEDAWRIRAPRRLIAELERSRQTDAGDP